MSRIGAQSLNRNDHQLAHNTVFLLKLAAQSVMFICPPSSRRWMKTLFENLKSLLPPPAARTL
jgi:hypothetical protein